MGDTKNNDFLCGSMKAVLLTHNFYIKTILLTNKFYGQSSAFAGIYLLASKHPVTPKHPKTPQNPQTPQNPKTLQNILKPPNGL